MKVLSAVPVDVGACVDPLEPLGKRGRRRDLFVYDQTRSLGETRGVLMELEHVALIVLRRIGFLGIRQVSGNPGRDDAFLASRR